MTEAGFTSVEVEPVVITRSPINARQDIDGTLRALPMSEQIGAMNPDAYTKMIDQIADEPSDYISDGTLRMPSTSMVAIARA